MRQAWAPDWADDVSWATVEALRESYMPPMPPLEEGGYLVGYLLEAGPVTSSGLGSSPLSFLEIQAWSNLIGITLEPWEVRCLHRLSCEYVRESHKAEKLGYPAPWKIEGVKQEQTALQQSLRALVAGKD